VVGNTLGLDGTPVYAGPGTRGSTSGAANFTWFTDNTHLMNYDLTLDWDGDSWMYWNNDFFPIDNLGYGNEGRNHNFHFTYQIHNSFTYQAGKGQYVEVAGDDDIWLYLNKGLTIDLAGISGATPDIVFLDSLGLTDGLNYDFDLFFAERHTLNAGLHIDTNIFPSPLVPEPVTMGMMLSGLLGLGFLKRRKTV